MLSTEFAKRPKMAVLRMVDEQPDAKWSIDRLSKFIFGQQNVLANFERRLAAHTYRLGQALTFARQKTPHGKWSQFLQSVGLSVATDNRARAVYTHFKDDEASLNRLTISEAYQLAGVSLGKCNSPSESATDGATEHVVGDNSNGDDQCTAVTGDCIDLDAQTPDCDDADSAEVVDLHDADSGDAESTEDGSGNEGLTSAESGSLDKSSQGASHTAKKSKLRTPPKENPNSLSRRLARVLTLSRTIPVDDSLHKSDVDHCHQLIAQIEQVLADIKQRLCDA